jgi:hypothetical protein
MNTKVSSNWERLQKKRAYGDEYPNLPVHYPVRERIFMISQNFSRNFKNSEY